MRMPDGSLKSWRDMTPDERFADQFRHFPTLLGRWRGGHAMFWKYTASHSMLTIRIERQGVPGHLEIRCSADFITGPVGWANAEIEIVPDDQHGVIIQDRTAGVRIVAKSVSLAENVKPVHAGS